MRSRNLIRLFILLALISVVLAIPRTRTSTKTPKATKNATKTTKTRTDTKTAVKTSPSPATTSPTDASPTSPDPTPPPACPTPMPSTQCDANRAAGRCLCIHAYGCPGYQSYNPTLCNPVIGTCSSATWATDDDGNPLLVYGCYSTA